MILFIALVQILQTISISLGVGSSTLAITNFFVAIADGVIDETERRMMGVVYVVLRIAMVLILITTVILIAYHHAGSGIFGLSGMALGQITALFVLYINAVLMTYHLMPSTFGPALQGGSWYTLGILSSLHLMGFTQFSYGEFLMGYITWLVLAVGIVNGIMATLKVIKENEEKEEQEKSALG